MSDQGTQRIHLDMNVDVTDCPVLRNQDGGAILYLRQQNGGQMAVTFTMLQAHEVGKQLLHPEIGNWVTARERGMAQPEA